MQSDGTNSFTWNARDQVATLNSASLQYDGFGRRTRNLQNTSFLFDGANAAQELSGVTATANLISGGIDEVFTRSDSTGSFTQLKDALASTIALVDASGNIQTTYAYDPFGNTTVAGAANTNPSQYTGRENEGNGLYFYRARYYSPLLHRFISQDPLGFSAGMNFYRYAGNDPINVSDPFGLAGKTINLGQGWTGRVDTFNVGGQASSEIHVFNPSGNEVGVISGTDGWIGKHGFPDNVRPAGIPEEVVNTINGVNVNQLRGEGTLPPKGEADITGMGYLRGGRILGVLPLISVITGELAAAADERRLLAGRKNLTEGQKRRIVCDHARIEGASGHVYTTFGPMPAEAVGCATWQTGGDMI